MVITTFVPSIVGKICYCMNWRPMVILRNQGGYHLINSLGGAECRIGYNEVISYIIEKDRVITAQLRTNLVSWHCAVYTSKCILRALKRMGFLETL